MNPPPNGDIQRASFVGRLSYRIAGELGGVEDQLPLKASPKLDTSEGVTSM